MGHFWERYFNRIYAQSYPEFIHDVLAAMDVANVYGNAVQYEDQYGTHPGDAGFKTSLRKGTDSVPTRAQGM
jgi:hypothetical protein